MLYACKSYYSLRFGTISPENLVKSALQYNIGTLLLADINNSTACIEFFHLCVEQNLNPIIGIEFRNDDDFLFTGIAKNNEGFRELNEFLTQYKLSKKRFPEKAPDFKNVFTIYPLKGKMETDLRHNEFIGIKASQINKIYNKKNRDLEKIVIYQPVTYNSDIEKAIHKHLRAVDHNILLTQLEDDFLADEDEHFIIPDQINETFKEYQILFDNTNKLIQSCSIHFDHKIKNKQVFTKSKQEDKELLTELAFTGMNNRYGKENTEARQRVLKELKIIDELGFSSYFLITHDIIQYSQSQGFRHVGRGSGANSVVAYCLGITDVDPIELNLYFERFINPKRTSPPDFDIDFSWKDRDAVTDYIFKKYKDRHVALLGTISTFKGKSIIRELGKVYGLPKEEIDQLVDYPDRILDRDHIAKKIFELSTQIADFPNLRSIHAGGILISEEPITNFTALDLPPKGYPTTQWDMYIAEDIGYEKLDILSQRGIGHINDAVQIIRTNKGENLDIHDIESIKKNKKVKHQLKIGETIGCFYIESPAMSGLLKKLMCDDYITLVAASSIIRPGVAKSGMMKEYIHRFHNPDEFKYIHPVMKEQLEETYGVMVYQEDVLKVCHHFAGLDLADADILRRAMSGKYRSKKEFKRIEQKYFSNCKAKGYSDKITNEVWRQIESFAGYSFSKAHSASYAVESFQSLYLKAHYPCEFMTAVINNFGGFYRTWVYVNEAQRCGAKIQLPCVNTSEYLTSIHRNDIYLGFVHLQEFESKLAHKVVAEREFNGKYTSLENFVKRTGITKEQLIILIRINAFRDTGQSKASLMWETHTLFNKTKKSHSMGTIFNLPTKKFSLPELEQNDLEETYDEMEILGFPVTMNAFDMLQTDFRGEIFAKDLNNYIGKKVRLMGRLATIKYVRTSKREIMNFGTFIDIHGEFFDTVNFPDSLKSYPYKGYGIYLILGKVVEEFGFASIEVEKMAKMPLKADPRSEDNNK